MGTMRLLHRNENQSHDRISVTSTITLLYAISATDQVYRDILKIP